MILPQFNSICWSSLNTHPSMVVWIGMHNPLCPIDSCLSAWPIVSGTVRRYGLVESLRTWVQVHRTSRKSLCDHAHNCNPRIGKKKREGEWRHEDLMVFWPPGQLQVCSLSPNKVESDRAGLPRLFSGFCMPVSIHTLHPCSYYTHTILKIIACNIN